MSQVPVKLLLLATSHGRADPGVPNALATVADVPVINYFMASLTSVTRLEPLKDKVFIVANEDSHGALVTWACNQALSGGFPLSNILNTRSTSKTSNAASDIAFAVRTAGLDDSHLIIASLDVMYKPHFNLQRIVEHAMIRAKDTMVFHRPAPGLYLNSHVQLELDDSSLGVANPQVLGIETNPAGTADGINAAVLAPLMVIRRTSLPDFLPASPPTAPAGSSPASTQTKQLGALVQACLLSAGKPVYALEEDFCMDVSTASGLEFASSFVEKVLHADANDGEGPAAKGLQEVTIAAQTLNIVPRGDRHIEELINSCSTDKRRYLELVAAAQPSIQETPVSATLCRTGGTGALPGRFVDPTIRRHTPKKQNPMYQTTNNSYGLKRPGEMDMPDTYAGSSTHFTSAFYGGPSKVSSMVTAITTSNVHKALDDF